MSSPEQNRRGWWRRNRWALLALPFVLLLIVGLGSYRFVNFWWQNELTEPVRAEPGGTATLTADWQDASGEHTREVTMGAGTTRAVASYVDDFGTENPVTQIEGTQVWRIMVEVEADADQVLSGCQYRVVDQHGRTARGSTVGIGPSMLGMDPCVPADAPGPAYDLGEEWGFEAPDTPPRPASYTRPFYVRLAEDAVPVELQVYWERPAFLALGLAPQDALGNRIEP